MNEKAIDTNKFELRNSSTRKGTMSILIILIGLLLTSTIYFYQKSKSSQTRASKENSAVSKSVVTKVGKLILLPANETPTIATIDDREKLKDQPFFKNARNGDTLLIYTKAQQAIIFREKDNFIINVGPVALNDMQSVAPKGK